MDTVITEPLEINSDPFMPDAERVRQLKRDNPSMTHKQIAERVGRKQTYVASVLRASKDIPRSNRGRPRKAKKSLNPTTNPVTIDFIKRLNPSASDDRVKQLEEQIKDLKAVLRYLEGKLYGAPV